MRSSGTARFFICDHPGAMRSLRKKTMGSRQPCDVAERGLAATSHRLHEPRVERRLGDALETLELPKISSIVSSPEVSSSGRAPSA